MTRWIDIDDRSLIATARRLSRQMAIDLGFSTSKTEEVAIVATETATNVLRHGGGGRMLIEPMITAAGAQLVIVAADDGPGIANLDWMMTDGASGSGTAGLGLGAIRRLSDHFDLWTQQGKGTVMTCAFQDKPVPPDGPRADVAGLTVCHPTETTCGDAWTTRQGRDGTDILLCDGLGHGPRASEAAAQVTSAFDTLRGDPVSVVSQLCSQLTGQRGAVAAMVQLIPDCKTMSYAGVGNISTLVIKGSKTKRFPVRDGRIGGPAIHPYGEDIDLSPGDVVILHSDGLTTLRPDDIGPALFNKSALTIAATLLHHHFRGRDDAGIVVVKV